MVPHVFLHTPAAEGSTKHAFEQSEHERQRDLGEQRLRGQPYAGEARYHEGRR